MFRYHQIQISVFAAALLLSAPLSRAAAWQQPSGFTGHWEGALDVGGTEITFMIDLKYEKDEWSGTIDIPVQGAKGLSLSGIGIEGTEIEFALANVPGNPVWRGTLSEGKITGTLSQSGMTIPFYLGREAVAGPSRPQEPKPPFPYREEEVSYSSGEVMLAGTLTLPPENGLFPAVLLITGSGAQDRNELIFGHKPFLLIADFLTRAGIAVLRVDDRGVGGSTLGSSPATTADLVQDVLRGVRLLREHPGIDPEKVGLIGHSEGGLIAPMAAAESNEVVFIVMLAGTGVPGMEILLEQTMLITKAAGATQEQLEAQWEAQRHALSLVAAGADSVEIREAVANLIAIQQARQPEGGRLEGETLDDVITGETRKVLQPWFRYFLTLDPRTALRSVKVPVLALNGELDLQVPPYQNLPEIEKALKEAGNTDVTIREFPGLNHLFQTTTTGSPAEYAGIEETMSPEVLETIRDWILARFRKGGTR